MPLPTWDVFIGLAFVIGIAYGFILRREKTITTLCSTYIGIVIATNFSSYLYELFNGNKFIANQIWIKSNASFSTVSIVTLLVSSFLIAGAINSTKSKAGDISPIEVLIYSALNIALLTAMVIGFLPDATRAGVMEGSKLASFIYSWRTAWVIIPPFALILLNFRRK